MDKTTRRSDVPVEPSFEEFDHTVYSRCSDSNMPVMAKFTPLSDEERAEAELALALRLR